MRTLALFFLLIAGIGSSSAQSVDVMGGMNFATVTNEPFYSFRSGYYVGAGKDISLSETISFRPEVYYSLQGAKGRGATRLTFHYLQMPLFFNYSFGKAGILLGPQVGLLIGANFKSDNASKFPLLPLMNKLDLLVGGGPYYKIMEQLKVEVRAVFGVTSFNSSDDEVLRNVMIQAGVSWTINNPASE